MKSNGVSVAFLYSYCTYLIVSGVDYGSYSLIGVIGLYMFFSVDYWFCYLTGGLSRLGLLFICYSISNDGLPDFFAALLRILEE